MSIYVVILTTFWQDNVQPVVFTTVYLTITMTSWLYITCYTTDQKQLRCSTMGYLCKMIYMSGQVVPLKFHLKGLLFKTWSFGLSSLLCLAPKPTMAVLFKNTSPNQERCWLKWQRAHGGAGLQITWLALKQV